MLQIIEEMILFVVGAPASLSQGEVFCFFIPLHPHSPFILAVRALLFGGNLSGSCFLRELPLPGNLDSPQGPPETVLFYCPHPSPPLFHVNHINTHPNTQDVVKGAKEMQP